MTSARAEAVSVGESFAPSTSHTKASLAIGCNMAIWQAAKDARLTRLFLLPIAPSCLIVPFFLQRASLALIGCRMSPDAGDHLIEQEQAKRPVGEAQRLSRPANVQQIGGPVMTLITAICHLRAHLKIEQFIERSLREGRLRKGGQRSHW